MRTPVFNDDSPTIREMRSCAPKPARASATPLSATPLSPRGQVLVVGMNHALADAVQCVLGDVYDVVACADPREAVLGIVRGNEYDVLLCDLDAPFVPAEEFRDQVAAMNPALAERFLFLGTDVRRAPARSDFIAKPVDVDTLKTKVAELVSLRTVPPHARPRE